MNNVPKKKSKNKARGTLAQNILSVFSSNPFISMNYKQVSGRLGMNDTASRELVQKFIDNLVKEGVLIEQKRGKFKIVSEYLQKSEDFRSTITGVVDMKHSGKAFIISKDLEDDVFISAENTNRAMHRDKVKVLLFPRRKGHKIEGQIIEIIERSRESFAGTLQTGKYYSFFIPDSQNIPVDIMIPNEHIGGAKNGEKVIVKLTDWPERSGNPIGEVIKVLGKPGINEVEMQSILVEFGFPLQFSAEVEKEAEIVGKEKYKAEVANRKDFREVFTITIDPEDAKDFDDALSLKKLENGNWQVGVHIADVSYYVKPGGRIDEEAFNRATSVYLVDRTIPMLPEILSNNLCSLRPHEDKLCFSAVFELDENAVIVSEWFGKSIINSNRRFNYDEVQQIIENKRGEYAEEISILNDLATKIREERYRKGSIGFETEEVKFRLDEKGKPLEAFIKEYKDSNKLIEDFMLLANRRVAEYVSKIRVNKEPKTFVYRVHDSPTPEKLLQFNEFISKMGYNLKTSTRKGLASSFNELFQKIKGKGEENLISNLAIRTMAKAFYSTENIGHYGLGFKYYTHFTSPIRRYPDLMVHRMLNDYLAGKVSYNKEEYEHNCLHSSEMERKATEAERASIKYKQAEFMLDKVGQEFDGLISGISKWGIYVELKETKCEGMVSLKDMTDDYYYIDEDNYIAVGQSRGKSYRLGDSVKIRVKRIDLSRKTMDFIFSK